MQTVTTTTIDDIREVSIILILLDYNKIDCDDPSSWLSAADLATETLV